MDVLYEDLFLPTDLQFVGTFVFQDFGIGGSDISSSLDESLHKLEGVLTEILFTHLTKTRSLNRKCLEKSPLIVPK